MLIAWVLTLPAAAIVAGGIYEIATNLGSGIAGSLITAVVAAVAAIALFMFTQRRGAVTAADVG
jgi:phosphate/sulfate permease